MSISIYFHLLSFSSKGSFCAIRKKYFFPTFVYSAYLRFYRWPLVRVGWLLMRETDEEGLTERGGEGRVVQVWVRLSRSFQLQDLTRANVKNFHPSIRNHLGYCSKGFFHCISISQEKQELDWVVISSAIESKVSSQFLWEKSFKNKHFFFAKPWVFVWVLDNFIAANQTEKGEILSQSYLNWMFMLLTQEIHEILGRVVKQVLK